MPIDSVLTDRSDSSADAVPAPAGSIAAAAGGSTAAAAADSTATSKIIYIFFVTTNALQHYIMGLI